MEVLQTKEDVLEAYTAPKTFKGVRQVGLKMKDAGWVNATEETIENLDEFAKKLNALKNKKVRYKIGTKDNLVREITAVEPIHIDIVQSGVPVSSSDESSTETYSAREAYLKAVLDAEWIITSAGKKSPFLAGLPVDWEVIHSIASTLFLHRR